MALASHELLRGCDTARYRGMDLLCGTGYGGRDRFPSVREGGSPCSGYVRRSVFWS